MALYSFAFSAFLEILLLGNFREGYLKQVSAKISGYSDSYSTRCAECAKLLRKHSADSVEIQFMNGLGDIGISLGKRMGASGLLSKGPVDESLKAASEAKTAS